MRPVPAALLAATGALVGYALYAGGGFGDGPLFWIGCGAFVLAALALGAMLAGFLPAPALGVEAWLFLALLTAFVLWNALSISWSIEPDRSWDYTNRGVAYLAFAVVGLALAAVVRRAPTVVAGGLAALLGVLALLALAGKVFPSVEPDYARLARMRWPVGYWNALALLLVLALPLALWLGSHVRRELGALLAYLALAALPLTFSRGGLALGIALVGGWLLLSEERFEGLLTLVAAVPPALAVAGLGLALPGVSSDGQPHSVRVHDGAIFGVAVTAGALVAVSLALLLARLRVEPDRRRELGRRGLIAFGALVVVGAIVYVAVVGPSHFLNPANEQLTNRQDRLTSLNSSNRWFWWQEAWRGFTDHPLKGTGAGSFDLTHRLYRTNALVATEPHNLPLQWLSELGLIGFLLAAGAALAALLGLWRALAVRDPERPARVALALAVPAYLLYSVFDFDWDFVAVTAPVLLVTGVVVAGPPRPVARRRPVLALAAVLLGAVAVYSTTAPWLANRRVDQAYTAVGSQHAISLADSAHSLNPLSATALIALSDMREATGDAAGARAALVEAIQAQPQNWRPWYDLGVFDLTVRNDACRAYVSLNRSYTLDRWGLPGEKDGPLVKARNAVNHGACTPLGSTS